MPKFVIERELPDAGSMTSDEVHTVAAKSNEILALMALHTRLTGHLTSSH